MSPFFKLFFPFAILLLPNLLLSQATIEGKGTLQYGTSTNTYFKQPSSYNLRYVSPRFRWSEADLSEEEQKHPWKSKRSRLMTELIYRPPFKVFALGVNYQFRFLKYKKLSLEAYWGLRFFFKPGPDFIRIKYLKGGKEIRYFNEGLLAQMHFGMFAPYVDIGVDGILTMGTEIYLHKIFRNPKKRYNLKPVESDS